MGWKANLLKLVQVIAVDVGSKSIAVLGNILHWQKKQEDINTRNTGLTRILV